MTFEEWQKDWAAYQRRLDHNQHINETILDKLQRQEARYPLRRLWALRWLEVKIWLLLLAGLWYCTAAFQAWSAPQLSAIVLALFATAGIIGSTGQLILLARLDYKKPILELQADIRQLRAHQLLFSRLLISSVPFYMAHIFFWFRLLLGIDLYQLGDPLWLNAQIGFSALLLPATAWLVRELGRTNSRFAWVGQLRAHLLGKEARQALSELEDIRRFSN